MSDTRALFARCLAGDAEAYAELGFALAERRAQRDRPLPPCVPGQCDTCCGSGEAIYSSRTVGRGDYRERCYTEGPCRACDGTGQRWLCDPDQGGCGLCRDGDPEAEEARCRC